MSQLWQVDGGLAVRWLRVLRDRWVTGLAIGTGVVVLAAWILLNAHPVYRAEARLRLEPPPPTPGLNQAGGLLGGLVGLRGDAFANDLEILSSRTVAEGVVADAALNVRVGAPRGWIRDSLFSTLTADRSTRRATFELNWTDSTVEVTQRSPEDSVVGSYRLNAPVDVGGVRFVARPPRSEDAPRRVTLTTTPFDEAVRSARGAIDVERTRINANVLDLTYDHSDPDVALATLQAMVGRFLEVRTDLQDREAGQTVDSLRVVASRTLDELRGVEVDLQRLQETTRLIDPETQGEVLVEHYAEATIDLTRARLELEAIQSVLESADTVAVSSRAWTRLIAFPRFLENETVAGVLNQLVALEQQSTEVATRRLPGNRDRRVVEEQVKQINATLRSLATAVRDGLVKEVGGLERQAAAMDSILAGLPQQTVRLARMKRTVELLSQAYVLTEQRVRQEELREALTFANVQVVDPPALRSRPVWPRVKLGLAVAILLGGMFGMMGMIIQDRVDGTVRCASDVELAIGAPVLAAFPRRGSKGVEIPVADGTFLLQRSEVITLAGVEAGGFVNQTVAALTNGSSPAVTNRARAQALPDPLTTLPTAGAAADLGAPVVIVVEWGRTRRDRLRRAAELLARGNATLLGAVMVYPPRRGPLVWT